VYLRYFLIVSVLRKTPGPARSGLPVIPDLIGYLYRGVLQVFISEAIVILLRGKCPKAKMEITDSQQYAKTGRGGDAEV
jgi:hypothetical protein